MTYPAYFVISAEHDGQCSILRLEGELDLTNKDVLWLAIGAALEHSPALLQVDLAALGFMDCAGLSVLIEAHRQLTASHRQLLITGAQPIVRRLISLLGLNTYLLPAALQNDLHESDTPEEGLPLLGARS
jgi:anti-sigma B factor antagonist